MSHRLVREAPDRYFETRLKLASGLHRCGVSKSIAIILPILLFGALTPSSRGQWLSLGVVAGGAVTNAYPTETTPVENDPGYIGIRYFSPSKDFVGGGRIELYLGSHWSLEGDVLYREMHATFAAVRTDGTLNGVSRANLVTFELPVLAKYRFTLAGLHPFIEAGPSFRTSGNVNISPASTHGIGAGAGLEFRFGRLALSPEVRYTRWAADNARNGNNTDPDQVELLAAFTYGDPREFQPFGKRFSIGGLVGVDMLADYSAAPVGDGSGQSGAHPLLGGPMIEVPLGPISIEADATYRVLHETYTFSNGRSGSSTLLLTQDTWQFTGLAKCRLPGSIGHGRARPFVETGPSFRASAGTHGITAGAGVETRLRALKLSPMVRFTLWSIDHDQPPINANELMLILGISF